MSFVKNDNQQLTVLDSTFNLTEREKRILEKSWAKTFADKVFPAIDENIFSVLYSEKASRPNTPVNVIVGPLILKKKNKGTPLPLMNEGSGELRVSRALFLCQWSGAFSLDDNRKRCIALDEKLRVLKLTDHHGACLHTGIIDIDIYNGKLWVDDAGIWVDVKGKYGNVIRDGKLPVFDCLDDT